MIVSEFCDGYNQVQQCNAAKKKFEAREAIIKNFEKPTEVYVLKKCDAI